MILESVGLNYKHFNGPFASPMSVKGRYSPNETVFPKINILLKRFHIKRKLQIVLRLGKRERSEEGYVQFYTFAISWL